MVHSNYPLYSLTFLKENLSSSHHNNRNEFTGQNWSQEKQKKKMCATNGYCNSHDYSSHEMLSRTNTNTTAESQLQVVNMAANLRGNLSRFRVES